LLFAAADRAMYYAKKNRLAEPYSVAVPEA
jgi:hypothetical protein